MSELPSLLSVAEDALKIIARYVLGPKCPSTDGFHLLVCSKKMLAIVSSQFPDWVEFRYGMLCAVSSNHAKLLQVLAVIKPHFPLSDSLYPLFLPKVKALLCLHSNKDTYQTYQSMMARYPLCRLSWTDALQHMLLSQTGILDWIFDEVRAAQLEFLKTTDKSRKNLLYFLIGKFYKRLDRAVLDDIQMLKCENLKKICEFISNRYL